MPLICQWFECRGWLVWISALGSQKTGSCPCSRTLTRTLSWWSLFCSFSSICRHHVNVVCLRKNSRPPHHIRLLTSFVLLINLPLLIDESLFHTSKWWKFGEEQTGSTAASSRRSPLQHGWKMEAESLQEFFLQLFWNQGMKQICYSWGFLLHRPRTHRVKHGGIHTLLYWTHARCCKAFFFSS